LDNLEENSHKGFYELIQEHSYIGWINADISLIQHNTKLYCINVLQISMALMYQICLEKFKNFKKIYFTEPLDILKLISSTDCKNPKVVIYLNQEIMEEFLSSEKKILILNDYLSIEIKDGKLYSLPQLIENQYIPIHRLPDFLLNLITMIDWTNELNWYFLIKP
jgi:DNA mismatch repair protein MLH1